MAFHPLDHDRSGRPGGSLPFAERGLDELYAEAKRLGLKVDKRSSRRTLGEAIDVERQRRRATGVERARAVADSIRSRWPQKAAEIDRAIADVGAGRRDEIKLDVRIGYRLEKFEGEITPGKQPYEVIEGEDNL